ncbi:hypothetical protein [Nocardiopsis sp. SBT366]|uniref:hypothetical protein n=1 Tax=Nocardiopsis sp. SBT366 TaxID=1580529 RepID=UPI00066C4F44|nr:hypothetical protein [Nocardiopsis sp. SBT366]
MTVTVIIITAVIVVLAVLVLLLLGMRALSIGSREDDYDDEYEYDDVEDNDRDDRRDRRERDDDPEDDGTAPRGRSRRSRQDAGGRAERRPKGKRQRGVDWEDDSDGLSDNDFWSSLSDEDAAPARSGGRADAPDPGAGPGDDDGYADDYDDYEDDRVSARQDTIIQAPPAGTGALPPAQPERGPTGPTDLAMLASLGQSNTPTPPEHAPRHQEQHPPEQGLGQGPAALPPSQGLPPTQGLPLTQGLPPARAAAPSPSSLNDDPLGTGSWSPRPPSTGDPFEGREPIRPAERREPVAQDPLGDGSLGGGNPGGNPLSGGPLGGGNPSGGPLGEGRSSYDGGSTNRSDYPPLTGGTGPGGGVGGAVPVSSDPLDPGFRPTPASGGDLSSPIWSSMDTGAHQRPDLSSLGGFGAGSGHGGPSGAHSAPGTGAQPAPGQPMGGPSVPGHQLPGSTDPLTGGYAASSFTPGSSYDSGSFSRSEYDTGTHQRSPYDTGAHSRDYQSGMPNQGGLGGPEYDTGTHHRPTYDTDSFTRSEYDTGTHQRSPYDTGAHSRDYQSGMPNQGGLGSQNGLPGQNTPGVPGGSNAPLWGGQDDSGGFGQPVQPGQPTVPGGGHHAGQPSPFGQGPVPPGPGGPVGGHGGPAYGGPAYPTGAYPADQLRGELPTTFPGHTQQGDPYGQQPHGGQGGFGGPDYNDPMRGGFAPQRPEPDYGYPPVEGWQPPPPEGTNGHGGTGQQQGQGPYGQAPYGRPAPDQEHYEGGYEDGRFR